MKIQTGSVCLPGGCDAKCPFCISSMTGNVKVNEDQMFKNMQPFLRLLSTGGATTILITGKGEPCLYPAMIDRTLSHVKNNTFIPFVELQTNGLKIAKWTETEEGMERLANWRDNGLNTISLSVVSYKEYQNAQVYLGSPSTINHGHPLDLEYPRWCKVIRKLKSLGYSIRVSGTMCKGYVDSTDEMKRFIGTFSNWGADQITLRSVVASPKPTNPYDETSQSAVVREWAEKHIIPDRKMKGFHKWFKRNAVTLMELPHGATVFDYRGRNFCLSNCLTRNAKTAHDELRQIILMPDGHISYDWAYKGAILL